VRSKEGDLLRRTARDLARVELTDPHLERFQAYLDVLCLWNRRMNLTGIRSRERMVVELLADSLVPVPHLPAAARLLDVGSGAGLPGIPIKIVRPDIRIDLLEPLEKRAVFLRQAVRILGLEGIRVLQGRTDDRGIPFRPKGYDVVTARAVAGLQRVVEMCAPHVAQGGMLIGFEGQDVEVRLDEARLSLEEADLHLEHSVAYDPRGTARERRTLFFRKGAIFEEGPGY